MSRANIYDLFRQPDNFEEMINQGCEYLKTGKFEQAEKTFNNLLENGGFACEIDTGLICAKYWNNRKAIMDRMVQGLKRANYLLDEWKIFKSFLNKIQLDKEQEKKNISAFDWDIILLTGHFVLSIAIDDLIEEYQKQAFPDIDLLIRIGEIFLELEYYEKAVEAFEYSRVFKKKDPYILSLLADAYFGCGNVNKAKVFFREAFFLNPDNVPLDKIKCSIIHGLVDIVKDNNYEKVAPWIPVFGIITNNFDVARELSEDEARELVIEIERLEIQYKSTNNENFLPYLLSKYLFLIDYLDKQIGIKDEADKLINKIKEFDPKIYDLYRENLKDNISKNKERRLYVNYDEHN